MTEDMGEFFNDLRDQSKQKRAQNRESSAKLLKDKGVEFSEHNLGAHLIVKHNGIIVDFWPGTGKWKFRNGHGRWGRGVFNLLHHIGVS